MQGSKIASTFLLLVCTELTTGQESKCWIQPCIRKTVISSNSSYLCVSCLEGDSYAMLLYIPLWCWEAKGWKRLAYCSACIWLLIPPFSKLMKYKRCNLNSRLLFKSRRRCRFATAQLKRQRLLETALLPFLVYQSRQAISKSVERARWERSPNNFTTLEQFFHKWRLSSWSFLFVFYQTSDRYKVYHCILGV